MSAYSRAQDALKHMPKITTRCLDLLWRAVCLGRLGAFYTETLDDRGLAIFGMRYVLMFRVSNLQPKTVSLSLFWATCFSKWQLMIDMPPNLWGLRRLKPPKVGSRRDFHTAKQTKLRRVLERDGRASAESSLRIICHLGG